MDELGKNVSLVEYVESEPFTTKDKKVDISKSKRDLDHDPKVSLEEGVPLTIDWMKSVYLDDNIRTDLRRVLGMQASPTLH